MTMTSAASTNPPRKKMGRPPTGRAVRAVMVRLHEPMDSLIDEWIARRLERPSRPDAIRRLLALALANEV
jgi:hypothetical protein